MRESDTHARAGGPMDNRLPSWLWQARSSDELIIEFGQGRAMKFPGRVLRIGTSKRAAAPTVQAPAGRQIVVKFIELTW